MQQILKGYDATFMAALRTERIEVKEQCTAQVEAAVPEQPGVDLSELCLEEGWRLDLLGCAFVRALDFTAVPIQSLMQGKGFSVPTDRLLSASSLQSSFEEVYDQ